MIQQNSKKTACGKYRWHHYAELENPAILQNLIQTHETINSIAEYLGCSRYMVSRAMKAHGIVKYKLIIPEDLKGKLEHLDPVSQTVRSKTPAILLHKPGVHHQNRQNT